jgi:hypothetical protein
LLANGDFDVDFKLKLETTSVLCFNIKFSLKQK